MPSSSKRLHRPNDSGRKPRNIRVVPERRETVDHVKLARALLHLAQAEYDAMNPEESELERDEYQRAANDSSSNTEE